MEKTVNYPRFRWFVVATYVLVTVASAFALISIAPLQVEVARTIGLDMGITVGIVMGTFNLLVALGAITGGAIIDRFGLVRVWFGCLGLLILGAVLTPLIGDTPKGITFVRIIQGAGTGPIMGCVPALAAQWFPAKERGIVAGLQGLAMGIGVTVGIVLGPMLAHLTGSWQTGLFWEGVFSSVIAFILVVIVALGPKPPVTHSVGKEENLSEITAEVKLALAQPTTWIAVICNFGLTWIFQAFNDLTPVYLSVDPPVGLGKGAIGSGQMFSLVSFIFMIGAVSGGFITEKLFKGREKPVIMMGYIVSCAAAYSLRVAGIVANDTSLLIALVLFGFFSSLIQPQVMAFISKHYPEHITGKVGGIVYGISVFGGVAGVATGAAALHATGQYIVSITIVAGVCVVGAIATSFLSPPQVYSQVNNEQSAFGEIQR